MRHLLPISLLFVAGLAFADTQHELRLTHLILRWTEAEGLIVSADGHPLMTLGVAPVVAYPPGWTWSYAGRESITSALTRKGQAQVLTVTCADPKVPWKQVITAGPGDRFSIAYAFRQIAWDEPMNYEVCAGQPTLLFIGSSFKVTTAAGPKTGQIPLEFAGGSNPFADASSGEFAMLLGKLAFKSTVGLTLYDYKQREHFWLGRDGPLPKGQEQTWSVEYTFAPQPFTIGGVSIADLALADPARAERADVSVKLSRAAGGPATVAAELQLVGAQAPPARQDVPLQPQPRPVKLALDLPGAGTYQTVFRLLDGANIIYQSPPLAVTVPRFISVAAGRVPFAPTDQGFVLVRVDAKAGEGLRLELQADGQALQAAPISAGDEVSLPLDLGKLTVGRHVLSAMLYRGNERLARAETPLLVANPQANGVAIDNRSHTLIVGGLPFCPQSCYTDMGTVNDVVEQEPQWGFNCIAPYLNDDIKWRHDNRETIRKLLDRCAQVGLYVHLDIRAASRKPQDEAKWAWLKEEIEAFKDHPALLAYYLADEPELGWSSPAECEEAYRRIKELDPWHPVTMVFCLSAAALRYSKGMDVVMTDPYPIPHSPVTGVVDFCERINSDLGRALPLWIVPQAFGGGEWWKREPSRQEERVMTYLALIHGARGVQYFIRRPPAQNPNSPDLWSECRRLMLELGQLTPVLASAETIPLAGTAGVSPASVHAAAFKERGAVTILCANTLNQPAQLELTVPGGWSGKAEVVFENRSVEVAQGKLADPIEAFGTRVYRLQVEAPPADRVTLDPRNVIVNPSWEEAHNVGTPDGCYTGIGADKGATWYVDPRTAVHGRQSLRLRTPTEGQSFSVAPFPVALVPGKRYALSVWAKGERAGQQFMLTMDTVKAADGTHALTTEWQEYRAEFVASERSKGRVGPSLRLISAGSAWFDALQVVPVE